MCRSEGQGNAPLIHQPYPPSPPHHTIRAQEDTDGLCTLRSSLGALGIGLFMSHPDCTPDPRLCPQAVTTPVSLQNGSLPDAASRTESLCESQRTASQTDRAPTWPARSRHTLRPANLLLDLPRPSLRSAFQALCSLLGSRAWRSPLLSA